MKTDSSKMAQNIKKRNTLEVCSNHREIIMLLDAKNVSNTHCRAENLTGPTSEEPGIERPGNCQCRGLEVRQSLSFWVLFMQWLYSVNRYVQLASSDSADWWEQSPS